MGEIMEVFENKKNREKAEDFIGWKSPDGKLEVVGVIGKNKHNRTLFKVTCTECSKDKEIYHYEQELHNELRGCNFQLYMDWSTECFENDSLFILNKLLDNCGLQEVQL